MNQLDPEGKMPSKLKTKLRSNKRRSQSADRETQHEITEGSLNHSVSNLDLNPSSTRKSRKDMRSNSMTPLRSKPRSNKRVPNRASLQNIEATSASLETIFSETGEHSGLSGCGMQTAGRAAELNTLDVPAESAQSANTSFDTSCHDVNAAPQMMGEKKVSRKKSRDAGKGSLERQDHLDQDQDSLTNSSSSQSNDAAFPRTQLEQLLQVPSPEYGSIAKVKKKSKSRNVKTAPSTPEAENRRPPRHAESTSQLEMSSGYGKRTTNDAVKGVDVVPDLKLHDKKGPASMSKSRNEKFHKLFKNIPKKKKVPTATLR